MCVCVCVCVDTHLSNDVRYLLLKVLETFLSYDTLHQIQSGRVSHLTWLVLPLPLGGVVQQVALNKKNYMHTNYSIISIIIIIIIPRCTFNSLQIKVT